MNPRESSFETRQPSWGGESQNYRLFSAFGVFNSHWVWLPAILGLEVVFMCGLCLMTAPLDIYYRDVRYLMEASGLVMFWLVPIFYSFEMIPSRYQLLYTLNPIAAVAVTFRRILMDAEAPSAGLLFQLSVVSLVFLAIGLAVFRSLERDLADYL
jgi:lipopolysaccharide transport system permease protein